MSDTIIVTIFTTASQEISRAAAGAPSITSHTRQARLYLATPSTDGGWLLETWREEGGQDARQQMELIPDTDSLAAGIADAVRAIADNEE